MKKQIKKLSLNKRTISNLNEVEMNNKVGGEYTEYRCHHGGYPTKTALEIKTPAPVTTPVTDVDILNG